MAQQDQIQEIKRRANEARAHAHCPYSNFHVGAAVLCEDGSIFTGVNVENVSYGLTVCAERVAIMNAITHGNTKFTAIAICSDTKSTFKETCGPCGACRQVLYEFTNDIDMYMVKPDMTSRKISFSDLLPMAFGPKALKEERDGGTGS